MLDKLIEYDENLFLFLNNLGTEYGDAFWMFMSHKFSAIPLYLLLLILCIKKLGLKSTLLIIIMVALLITATDQLANAFKYGFKRLRPCHDDDIFSKMQIGRAHV